MLTIISVSYKSKEFLDINYKLVKTLNPETPFNWIIVQNTPTSELDNDLAMDDPRFQMIKGPTLTIPEKECSFYRSIHHAKALNLALTYTNSDLILILDPDCFILMPNWIEIISKHMQTENIVFFGSPYHPKYYTHYRNFPNAICMFINRRLMQEKNYFSLDFMPIFEGRILLNKALFEAIQYHSQPKKLLKFFSSSTRMFPLELQDLYLIIKKMIKKCIYSFFSTKRQQQFERGFDQFKVRKCCDTGYKIYNQYRSLFKHQTLKIFSLDQRSCMTKFFESILPDRYRTFPRNTTYIEKTSSPLFAEFGSHGEQFFWNHQLFGFHLKGVLDSLSKESKDKYQNLVIQKIEELIDALEINNNLKNQEFGMEVSQNFYSE